MLLQDVIHTHNHFAREFQTAYQQYANSRFGFLNMVIKDSQHTGRQYDQQTYPEVAAMVAENWTTGNFAEHAIVMRDNVGGLRTISSLHSSYIPLHYVLMFPFGDEGWFVDMRSSTPVGPGQDTYKVTLQDYCSYMMMTRDNYYIQHYGKLFQQYLVHESATPRLRLGIRYFFSTKNITNYPAKTMIYNFMMEYTCNPRWPEIKSATTPGQSGYDRPDICTRVFKLKVDNMMKDIVKKNCFGKTIGYVGTIEYQKRGLPHLHLVLILAPH